MKKWLWILLAVVVIGAAVWYFSCGGGMGGKTAGEMAPGMSAPMETMPSEMATAEGASEAGTVNTQGEGESADH